VGLDGDGESHWGVASTRSGEGEGTDEAVRYWVECVCECESAWVGE
jgi:hypothetical protein